MACQGSVKSPVSSVCGFGDHVGRVDQALPEASRRCRTSRSDSGASAAVTSAEVVGCGAGEGVGDGSGEAFDQQGVAVDPAECPIGNRHLGQSLACDVAWSGQRPAEEYGAGQGR
jgi:hypothetical protein